MKFNHNTLMALAMNANLGFLMLDNVRIPVKITSVDHESSPSSSGKTTFECMVVNDDQIGIVPTFHEVRKILNATYGRTGFAYGKCPERTISPFQIQKVIFNNPATIVFWADGTKTVVKCQEGDTYSRETGLATAIAKKALGNKGNFNDVFKKFIPEY
jgi:hypothetical protein